MLHFAAVLAFEGATFPSWTRWSAESGPTGTLVARNDARAIAGTRTCHIGWTTRESFYRRAGCRPWRRYAMFTRPG
jgi:hypothetical protein